ncbi:hypothetical protein [Nonomuraea fuscirosea]|uniref:hypothetical protein n=1 Tax=Nonomuraea fuscirosea TaxID=1291556 RepID=UPI0033D99195
MQVLGVNWPILTLTGSATSVGLSLVMQALPTLVLGMWGGALAGAALSIVSAGAGALGGPLLGRPSDTFGPRAALEIGGVACVPASLLAAVGLARPSGRTVKQAIRVRPRLENV